jgi:uncharacterized protein (TIGR03000 family)
VVPEPPAEEGGAAKPETEEAPVPPDATQPGTGESAWRNSAILNVNVPAEAKVYVNGYLTRSTGEARSYVARNLVAGQLYTYEVRAEMMRDGERVEETKVIDLSAGRSERLAFDLTSASPITTVTLHVPEDAKVSLAGTPMTSKGPVRVFTTKKLASGKSWSNYKIVVTAQRDGRELTREETITLKAGDDQTLSFDFDAEKVAVAR